ncbi:MAG: hypothetical protein HYX35_03915 [Proteobacteria bacterium]|nr:hypothetical protein [Pseudomonadota bacterium]
MKNIKTLLQTGKIKEALVAFRALPEAQQEDFFRELAPTLFPPDFLAVLVQKLKPGYSFEDFHQAHLPPLKKGQDLAHYFPYPCYVMSLQDKDNPSNIMTLGFAWLEEQKIEETFKEIAETEKMRHDKIATVADKIGPTLVYRVKEVAKLGS